MTDEMIPEDELDAIVAQLERAGLIQTYTRPDGRTAYRLTPQGGRVGWMLALSGDDGIILDALLGADGEG